MFEGKSALDVLTMGGVTLYVLLFCSVLSIGVIIERLWYYASRSRPQRRAFMERIRVALKSGERGRAEEICHGVNAPFAAVVLSAIQSDARDAKALSGTLERAISIETGKLERLTSIVGTIGNVAVYIGLFGTVLGIIRAFQDISAAATGGMDVVIGGVAEALVTTAAGLAVAVPAVIAYNYFMRRIERFVNDMELCASELSDIMAR